MSLSLNLLVVRCRNLESSRSFYESLGLVFAREQHGAGPIHYSTQLGPTVLELYPTSAASSNVRLGLTVPNVAAAIEAVRALGGQVVREPTATVTALVRDPDDNTVELTAG